MKHALCFLSLFLLSQLGQAATRTAFTASYNDVNNAVNGTGTMSGGTNYTTPASNGDTINVPAGNLTWTNTVHMGAKAISIIGAGSSSTIITNLAPGGAIFDSFGAGNTLLRWSGIKVIGYHNMLGSIEVVGPASKLRVDHCIFDQGDFAIGTNHDGPYKGTGPVWGCVDNCQFINMKRPIFPFDVRVGEGTPPAPHAGAAAWNEFLANPTSYFGSTKTMVYEDCQFIWNSSNTECNSQGMLYGQNGGSACVRKSSTLGTDLKIDAHGDSIGQYFSTLFYEVYDMIFNGPLVSPTLVCAPDPPGTATGYYAGHQGVQMFLRGGRHVMHDLTFASGGSYPTTLTIYFCNDMVSHRVQGSYFWGYQFGAQTTMSNMVSVVEHATGCDASSTYSHDHIRLGTEYFLAAPQQGQVLYPYSPLQYPHPLRQGDNPTDPILSVTPAFQDFGYVDVNGSSSLTCVVTNTGGGTLTGTASISAPFVITSGASYSLTTNQTQNVVIAYRPTVDAILDQQNLVFTGGAGATFQLTGRTPLGLEWDSTVGILSNFTVNPSDTTISQGTETLDPAAGGRALYRFKVITAGDYTLAALVNWPDSGSNSFFYNIDSEPTSPANVWTGTLTTGLQSRPLTWAAEVTAHVHTLSAGNHDLIVRGREANAKLGHITATAVVTPTPAPIIQVTPTSVNFGAVEFGSSSTQNVTVKNNGGGMLSGTASTSSPFSVTQGATYSLGSGEQQLVYVKYTPAGYSANNSGNLTFTGGGATVVSLSGTSPAAPVPVNPVIQVLPATLDFGVVAIGSHLDQNVTVKNIGTGTLTGTATADPPFYIINDADYSLGAKATKQLIVRFQPALIDNFVADVTFTGGDGTTVSVSGDVPVPPDFEPPSGVIISPIGTQTITQGGSVSFAGGGNDPAGTALSYLWTFGSGSGIADSTAQVPGSKTFNNVGTFTVTLTVTNEDDVSDPHPPSRTIIVNSASTTTVPDFVHVLPP